MTTRQSAARNPTTAPRIRWASASAPQPHVTRRAAQVGDQDAHDVAQRLIANRLRSARIPARIARAARANRSCRSTRIAFGRLRAGRLRHAVRGHEPVFLDQVERPLPLAAIVEPHHLLREVPAQGVAVERLLPLDDSTHVVERLARLLQEVDEVEVRLGEGFLAGDRRRS